MANNMKNNGGFIPGIRPGKPTSDYFSRILKKLTLFGAIFLAILAVIPTLFTKITQLTSPFSATGLLIMVSTALETAQVLEAQMMMRHYKGFLN